MLFEDTNANTPSVSLKGFEVKILIPTIML